MESCGRRGGWGSGARLNHTINIQLLALKRWQDFFICTAQQPSQCRAVEGRGGWGGSENSEHLPPCLFECHAAVDVDGHVLRLKLIGVLRVGDVV